MLETNFDEVAKSTRVPGASIPGSQENKKKAQQFAVVDVNYDAAVATYIQQFLGAEKANRLESIMSEAVIFAMNSGQWRRAKLAQRAYEQIAMPFALGPMIAGVYIALGLGRVNEGIQYLESVQESIPKISFWSLRGFIGMFMIFSERKAEAEAVLNEVVNQGDDISCAMAEQLLSQFFGKARKTATRHARVPGVPL